MRWSSGCDLNEACTQQPPPSLEFNIQAAELLCAHSHLKDCSVPSRLNQYSVQTVELRCAMIKKPCRVLLRLNTMVWVAGRLTLQIRSAVVGYMRSL